MRGCNEEESKQESGEGSPEKMIHDDTRFLVRGDGSSDPRRIQRGTSRPRGLCRVYESVAVS